MSARGRNDGHCPRCTRCDPIAGVLESRVRPLSARAARPPPSSLSRGRPVSRRPLREAHVSTQQSQAQEEARVSVSYAHTRGPGDCQGPSQSRPVAARGLIWRIRDHGTFSALYRARPSHRGPVSVRVVDTADRCGLPRVAYAVGKGVGGAVARNRLRRRIRSAVREERAALRDGRAYLISARPVAAQLPFAELRSTLRRALRETPDNRQ